MVTWRLAYNRGNGQKSARPAPLPAESVDADRVLAFINTLSGRPTAAPVERLDSYEALVAWAREQHLVSAAAAERLVAEARKHPHQAAAVLARAKEFPRSAATASPRRSTQAASRAPPC